MTEINYLGILKKISCEHVQVIESVQAMRCRITLEMRSRELKNNPWFKL